MPPFLRIDRLLKTARRLVRSSGLGILSMLLQRTVRGPTLLTPVRRITLGDDATDCALRPDSSVVERGPEKAGVGGSIPSLATTPFLLQLNLGRDRALSAAQCLTRGTQKGRRRRPGVPSDRSSSLGWGSIRSLATTPPKNTSCGCPILRVFCEGWVYALRFGATRPRQARGPSQRPASAPRHLMQRPSRIPLPSR
jgi:hypothetical protein